METLRDLKKGLQQVKESVRPHNSPGIIINMTVGKNPKKVFTFLWGSAKNKAVTYSKKAQEIIKNLDK